MLSVVTKPVVTVDVTYTLVIISYNKAKKVSLSGSTRFFSDKARGLFLESPGNFVARYQLFKLKYKEWNRKHGGPS